MNHSQEHESGEEVQQLMAWIQAQTSQSQQWLQALASFPIEPFPMPEPLPFDIALDKSLIASGLEKSLAHAGSNVTLVDFPMERPRQDSIVSDYTESSASVAESDSFPAKRHQVKRACGTSISASNLKACLVAIMQRE